MFKTLIIVANLVRDAEVRQNKENEDFTSFSIAYERGFGDKKEVIYPEVTVNGSAIAKSLTKGRQIVITADDLIPYSYSKKEGGEGTGYRLVGTEVFLGDVALAFIRGRLTGDVSELEGKDFAVPRLLSNVRKGKDKEALVASSVVLGAKYLEKTKPSLKKGKTLNVFGVVETNAYTGQNGPGSEIRFVTSTVDLGPDAKAKTDAPVAETADSDIPE